MESSSCSTSGTRCFARVRNPMMCHKRGKVNGIATTPNGAYPRNVLSSIESKGTIHRYVVDTCGS